MGEKEGWKELWLDYFIGSTTIHGLPFLCARNSLIGRRFLWCILMLGCTGAFLFNFSQRLTYFLSDPVNVNIMINELSVMRMPAITICNHNNYRVSKAAELGVYPYLLELYNQHRATPEADEYFKHFDPELNITAEIAHQKESMIFSCQFSTEKCDARNFTRVFTDFGVCYTFNGGKDLSRALTVRQSGSRSGLHLLINVEQYEYMEGPERTAGVKVLIHEPTSLISVGDFGFSVPPGMQGLVGMSMTRVTNLPFGKIQCAEKELRYFLGYNYSTALCDLECETDFVREHCDCHPSFVPTENNSKALPFCSPVDFVSCVEPKRVEFRASVSEQCECPLSCTSVSYIPSLSYASLSRFNARNILETTDPDTLSSLRNQFLTARETVARTRDGKKDLSRFTHFQELIEELAAQSVKPDFEFLFATLPKELHHQCFLNAQRLVREYRNVTLLALGKLRDLVNPMTDYDRGMLISSYAQMLWDVLRRIKYLLKTKVEPLYAAIENGLSDPETARYLSDSLSLEVIRISDTLTELVGDFNASGTAFAELIMDNHFLLNQTAFNSYFQQFQIFFSEEMSCIPQVSERIKSGFTTIGSWIRDGMAKRKLSGHERNGTEKIAAEIFAIRLKCQTELINNGKYSKESVERTYMDYLSQLDRESEQIFLSFHSLFTSTDSFDFQTMNGRVILRSMKELQRSYAKGEMSKLQIANNMTSSDFNNEVALFLEFLKSVRNYISLSRQEMLNYLDLFAELMSSVPPVIRAYYQYEEPDIFQLYFGGVLFSEDEVSWCKDQIDGVVTSKLKVLGSIEREIQADLNQQINSMRDYIGECEMNTQFVLNNFLDLSIYYRELREEVVTQQKAYEIWGLISDIGGGMGLFLGASFITLFELIDVFCEMLRRNLLCNPEIKEERREMPQLNGGAVQHIYNIPLVYGKTNETSS